MPSGNAIANARALARIGALLAMNGELDGRRYLSREIVEQASTLQSSADDLLLGPVHFGLGLGLHSESFPAPTPSAFHWGGYGGSWLVMDRTTGISCAYAMNGLRTHTIDGSLPLDPRQAKLWRVLREVMAKLGADQI